jgi:hypothetical protein
MRKFAGLRRHYDANTLWSKEIQEGKVFPLDIVYAYNIKLSI